MSATAFTLTLPAPKVRKAQAPPAKAHKNKRRYSRKIKHKADPRDERRQAPVTPGAFRLMRLPGPAGAGRRNASARGEAVRA